MRQLYLLILSFLLIGGVVRAQNGSRLISVDYNRAGIEQVVTDLEGKTGYHFYYDAKTYDSLRVTLQMSQQPLNKVLDAMFNNTSYRYAITDQQEVLLTKGRAIQTSLAEGFFSRRTTTAVAGNQQNNVPVFDDRQAQESTLENKTYEIGFKTNTIGPGNATIAGYVKDVKTGEPISGAAIYATDAKAGVNTDQYGFYSLTLPKGRHTLLVTALGMRESRRQLVMYSDGKLNIDIQEQAQVLREVKISAAKLANITSVQMGAAKMDIKTIKEIPAVFGEADVLRAVLVLPGVQTVGEATTGFNVRGGSADQNLILLDGMTIYNPSHFFGFFSAFNPELVKDVELFKGDIPERLGGRLSSVLEVTNREADSSKYTGSAGIGLLTSRLDVEGPIDKKTSFIIGGRGTYADWLLKLLPQAYKNSTAHFYDVDLKIRHDFDPKNSLTVEAYTSYDNFRLNSDTTYAYRNQNTQLKWRHNFNPKFSSNVSAGFDRYEYSVESTLNPVNAYDLKFDINQTNFHADFNYFPNSKTSYDFGVSSIFYRIHPGAFEPVGIKSLEVPDIVPVQQGLESAAYLGGKFDLSDKFSISIGGRLSMFNVVGPAEVYNYAPNLARDATTVTDSAAYGPNKIIKTYLNPEVRFSARYILSPNTSIKAGFNTLHQYIHLLSNTTAISPTDVYQLSNSNIKPQSGQQVSLGIYRNLKQNTIETSLEVYYKKIQNYLDYRSGATLLLNNNIERDVINTDGKAYGIELLIRKTAGRLTGLMSYTYSRTMLQQNDPFVTPLVNGGAWYPANYDKPHDFNFTGNYHVSKRYSFSINATYSTGRPITLPIAKYVYDNSERVYYSDRNAYRIPDYFRTDFSLNIDGNHKVHQFFHNSWTVGVYNLTGQQNAYSTYFSEQGGVISGHKLSIFAAPIPFVNYNVKF